LRYRLEAISKLGFLFEIKAWPRINTVGAPKEVPLGYILKYVEDLRRGHNADIGQKDFFEIASILNIPQFITAS